MQNCDWVTIITIVACLFAILGVMVGLFLYLANRIDGLGVSFRSEMNMLRGDIENLRVELKDLRRDVNNEMRDFHGRLCSIDERTRKPNTNP